VARHRGARTVIWCDSGVRAVRDLQGFIDVVEREGHAFFNGGTAGAMLGNRTSDACLEALKMSRDEAVGLPLLAGTLYAFDFTNARTVKFFDEWAAALASGL
jgi:hypothetical protein